MGGWRTAAEHGPSAQAAPGVPGRPACPAIRTLLSGDGGVHPLDRRPVTCLLWLTRANSAPVLSAAKKASQRSSMASFIEQTHLSLTQLAADGADGQRIADRAVATWRDIDAALSPIIGRRGVAALFKRSVLLAVPRQASLVSADENVDAPGDFAALRAALSAQTAADAIATNGALLKTFVDLLTNLIGVSLTERLLQSVLDIPSRHGAV